MHTYFRKPEIVEAHQWFKNGDHPGDGHPRQEGKVVRYFRHPDVPWDSKCRKCGRMMMDHGWIDVPDDGITVCPGDWIVKYQDDDWEVCSDKEFRHQFEPVDEETQA